ncbi:MAG: MBL fold metallo-hydrolase, partial [Anaerolineales bacterium]
IIAHDSVRPRLLEYPEVVRKSFPARLKALESEIAGIADAADPYRVALEKDVGLVKYFIDSAAAFKPETAAPPGITYEGHVKLWLGEQEVQVFHLGPGHTDGDSLVYFRNEKVLHMGDLLFQGTYPFVDTAAGGRVSGYVENLDRAIALVPPDTQVIPGHGPVTDIAGLRRMRDFLSDLLAQVDKAVQAGVSRGDAVRAIKMDAYPDIKPGFRTLGNLVSAAYDELKAKR